jgi:hypothetical protein
VTEGEGGRRQVNKTFSLSQNFSFSDVCPPPKKKVSSEEERRDSTETVRQSVGKEKMKIDTINSGEVKNGTGKIML